METSVALDTCNITFFLRSKLALCNTTRHLARFLSQKRAEVASAAHWVAIAALNVLKARVVPQRLVSTAAGVE